jgi:hypothetical protein
MGHSYSITIFLEDISSIEIRYNSHIIFLILAAIVGLFWVYLLFASSGYSSNGSSPTGAFLLALLFALLYWITRRHVISISSDGGKSLNFLVSQMKEDQIQEFTHKVHAAKAERMRELFKV